MLLEVPAKNVYSVNSVRFNKKYGSFVTGGDDGEIKVWDKDNRQRLHEITSWKPMPVTTIDFNKDCTAMGYATGYNWFKGYKDEKWCNKGWRKGGVCLHYVDPKKFSYH